MRFHALLAVKDEADIILQTLRHALTWADSIYVMDTGSLDDTWEIVQDFASKDTRVRPLRKDAVVFDDALVRGWMFSVAREQMEEGDWFLRVDADEFHHIPPPEFLRTRVHKHETVVWHQYYDFRLTASEVRAWQDGVESLADRARNIADRRRWYTTSPYGEPRLCRYRRTMRWPASASFPVNAGYVARARLPIRHYLHRDPPQMDRRCRIRALSIAANGNQLFTGYTKSDVQRLRAALQPGEECSTPLRRSATKSLETEWWRFITPDDLPGLKHWQRGAPLPEVEFTNHLAPWPKRAVQRCVHGFMLPYLDPLRPSWPADAYPQRWSPTMVEASLAVSDGNLVYPPRVS